MKTTLKLLCLAPYPVENAAVRCRLLQYNVHLQAAGIEIIFRPFLRSPAFKRLYEPGHTLNKALAMLGATLRRCADVVQATRCDVVLLHREAAFIGPPVFEHLIARGLKRPMVFDFDDAIHILLANTANRKLATLLKSPGKTPQTIKMSRAVIAGNTQLANYAASLNTAVTEIPTVVDATRVVPAPHRSADKRSSPVVLGWIGTPSNLPYLSSIFPVLQELSKRHDIVVRIVGAGQKIELLGVVVDNRSWSLETELSMLQSFDIGLYPMTENAWSMGKSGFKAIEYMAVGIPVIGSPVGAVCDIVHHGIHGFLPATQEAWVESLSSLITDATLRGELGTAGRARVEEWYCVSQQAPRLCNVIKNAAL